MGVRRASLPHRCEIATARAELLKQALDSEDNVHFLTEELSGFVAARISRDNLDAQIAGVSDSIAVLQSELAKPAKRPSEAAGGLPTV